MSSNNNRANTDYILLLNLERATVAAFKAKNDRDFSKNFDSAYVGIADDGFKDAAGEISGMHKIDLQQIDLENEKVSFPASNIGVVTYTMNVTGTRGGSKIAGAIFTSSVYVKKGELWTVVLHTESMTPKKQ
jgi:hypothetical protein